MANNTFSNTRATAANGRDTLQKTGNDADRIRQLLPGSSFGFLTPQQLSELTDYQRPKDQIRWLQARGWRFEVGASGRPKIAIEEFLHRMGPREKRGSGSATPDFTWMTKNA